MSLTAEKTAVFTNTVYRILVQAKTPASNQKILRSAHQSELSALQGCVANRLYFLAGSLSKDDVRLLATAVLADPVTEALQIDLAAETAVSAQPNLIETTYLPGVTDPPAENLLRAAKTLGIDGLSEAATGEQFILEGTLSEIEKIQLASQILANPVVQRFAIDAHITPPFIEAQLADETVDLIDFREADDDKLLQISKERRLSMDLNEMRALQTYYRQEGRAATDVELEMLAQTWSEHCVHKTFKAKIEYTGPDGQTETIDGILNQYIRAATEKVNKPWVRSAFVDNAGIVEFDDQFDLAFKVETHNHPSALEPFGGANTGVGGCIRDVLGVSARPIANTDVLCFGLPDTPASDVPEGVLHPRQIADGVIHGIEDYGNKMGIPTVNGSIQYHKGYMANPLVYCGCLGILPIGSHKTEPQAGDFVIAIGGRTGRDGLRGATFSSMEMDVETSEIAGTAVQIGHPIMEKQVLEVVLKARDAELYNAITDCGAGGYSSAVGEMGETLGAVIQLQNVTLKYPGLRPWEIWLSEAQERMVLAVPPEKLDALQAICDGQDVELINLGTFGNNGRIQLYYGEKLVGDLSMTFLHDGIPQRELIANWQGARSDKSEERREKREERREKRGERSEEGIAPSLHHSITPSSGRSTAKQHPQSPITNYQSPITNYQSSLIYLLQHPDIRSKEDVIRRYDHEVQGGTAVKPLVGVANQGPSDATVLVPQNSQQATVNKQQITSSDQTPTKAAALSNGIRPSYSAYDPYNMAWAVIDEAMRNVVAVGADPDQVSILDNFCWGNPNLPDRLGALVRCSQGCYDAAVAYQTPFISGKDSLNNEYTGADGQKHAIPGTLLVSALGIVPDVTKTVTMDLKGEGNLLFIVGETKNELLGSHYQAISNPSTSSAESLQSPILRQAQDMVSNLQMPQPVHDALDRFRLVHQAMQDGLIAACHDCSEGGLAVTLAEMALAGDLGATVDLTAVSPEQNLNEEAALFSESLSRFVIEVRPDDAVTLKNKLNDVPLYPIGTVQGETLIVNGRSNTLINLSIGELDTAWRGHVRSGEKRGERREERGESGEKSNPQSPILRQAQDKFPNPQSTPNILILHANGTNRDNDAALACELAGGSPEIVHINQLLSGEKRLDDYGMVVVPGGFSYGDDLGAGVMWSLDLEHRFAEQMARFVENGRLLLGICNGFQTLVKANLLPSPNWHTQDNQRAVTLTYNEKARFECRWVTLEPNAQSPSIFTKDLIEPIYCPIAHGEGRLMVRDEAVLNKLNEENLIPLVYGGARSGYPTNPNGSTANIAALCNPRGNVMGLMPHPENHIFPWQHPRSHRGEVGLDGLRLFANGIKHL